MNPLVAIIAAIVGYYLFTKNTAATAATPTLAQESAQLSQEIKVVSGGQTAIPMGTSASVAAQLTQLTGIVTPVASQIFDTLPNAGAVTLGGGSATTGYNPMAGMGTDMEIAQAEKLVQQVTGLALQVAGITVPFIGIAFVGISTIIGLISAHHAAALKKEGETLNKFDPLALEAMVLVVQAVICGEITTVEDAHRYLWQIVTDWYANVKSIQRGTWPYKLTTSQDPSILAGVGIGGPGDPSIGTKNWFGSSDRPDPCNAACTVGHYAIERTAQIALLVCQAIFDGHHGIMTLPAILPHDTQTGVKQIQMLY